MKSQTPSLQVGFYNRVYISEPLNITKVYSDDFEQQVDIQKIADHHYKIKFPDGNYNEYFYTDGVCSKIEIHHSLYSASIELTSQFSSIILKTAV